MHYLLALVFSPQVDAAQRAATGLASACVAGATRGDPPPLQQRHEVPALAVQREDVAVKTDVPQAACTEKRQHVIEKTNWQFT